MSSVVCRVGLIGVLIFIYTQFIQMVIFMKVFLKTVFFKHTENRVIKHFIDINSRKSHFTLYEFDISTQKNLIAGQSFSLDSNFYPTNPVLIPMNKQQLH